MRWHPKVRLDTMLLRDCLEMSRGAAESVILGPHSFPEGKELIIIILVLRNTITVYSRKIWRGIKFGGLIYMSTAILSYLHNNNINLRMAIPYRTAKFKSANIKLNFLQWRFWA